MAPKGRSKAPPSEKTVIWTIANIVVKTMAGLIIKNDVKLITVTGTVKTRSWPILSSRIKSKPI